MAAVVINGMGKRMKEQEANGDDNHSLSCNKKARMVWSDDLHEKFVAAVNKLGLHEAVPRNIVNLMNVQGITTAHVASHLQKYRLRKKKAAHQADRVPSTLINTSFNIHQSETIPAEIYSPSGLNISEVCPSTLVQSQNINNNSLNIHPPPSTFPIYHQTSTFPTHSQNIIDNSFNIHPSYNFPANHNSTLLLPNNMPLHQSHTLPNTDIYSPTAFNMSGLTPSTLIPRPTQSQNISSIIHPPPSTFPKYHHTSTFPTLVNQSTSPPVFATTLDFHDTRSRATNCPFVESSSKSPSIWDYDWYTKYMKREPHLNNSLPESESDKTSQNSQMSSQQTEPFMDGSASSLEYTNLQLQSTTPFGFAATTFEFHDLGTYVGSTSSKSTSIWDDDWYTKYLKRKPQSLQFSHNSLPVLESDINNSHNVEPFTVGSATSLEDKNIDISDYTVGSATSLEDKNIDISDYNLCSENSPIDFSVEETINTLEWGCLEEDLIDVWRCLEEENVLNVKL